MQIGDYPSKDKEQKFDLFHLVFKKTSPGEFWKWMFAGIPAGKIMVQLTFPSYSRGLVFLICAILKHFSNYRLISIKSWITLNNTKHILMGEPCFVNIIPGKYSRVRIMAPSLLHMDNPCNRFYCRTDYNIY
jgi:hypothetical protein